VCSATVVARSVLEALATKDATASNYHKLHHLFNNQNP